MLTCSIKGDTGVVSHTAPGGGLYGHFMRTGERKFSVDLTIAAKDTDDIQTLFQNDTEIAVSLAVNSGSDAQMTFSWPFVHLKANKIGSKDQMTIWTLSWDETTTLQKSGQKAFAATVINDEPTYLVAV